MLSVVVPVYNDQKYLEGCLRSIFGSDYPDFEVIVVNDASTDDSLEIARKFPCQIVDLKTNAGVANARNKGANNAKGDILVFFDSDVEVERDTLSRFAKAHQRTDIKVCQCQISPCSLTPGYIPELMAVIWNYVACLMAPYSTAVRSMSFSIDKSVFFEIGGFNTVFKSAGGEEYEIGRVIQQHDYRIFLDSSFRIHHNFENFLSRFKKLFRRSYVYGRFVLQRNFKLDRGHGTLKEGINSLLSVIGILELLISSFIGWTFLLFLATIIIQLLSDLDQGIYVTRKKGLFFFIRSIPITYLWYFAMGLGVIKAGLMHYFTKVCSTLRKITFLLSKTPAYVIFFVTAKCNAGCKHCFNWKKVQEQGVSDDLSLEEIEKMSKSWGNIKYMTYSGGEPSLREDIVEITQSFFKNNHLEMLNFITNGFAVTSVVSKIKKILRTCPGLDLTVSFSIDGLGDQHDSIRNAPGIFGRVLESIDKIRNLEKYYPNLKILAITTYSSFNRDNIFDIVDYITKGLKLEMILNYVRGDTLEKSADQVDLDTYMKATETIAKQNAINSRRSSIVRALDNVCFKLIAKTKEEKKSLIPCLVGKKLIEIGNDGRIFPCEMLDVDFGNVCDFNYDINKVLKTKKAYDFFKFLNKRDCFCTWECAMKNNIVYSIPKYPSLFLEWFRQGLSLKN